MNFLANLIEAGPHGIVANVLDCYIVVSEFELQSRYYVHFRTNTLQKGMNPPSTQQKGTMGSGTIYSTTIVLQR